MGVGLGIIVINSRNYLIRLVFLAVMTVLRLLLEAVVVVRAHDSGN